MHCNMQVNLRWGGVMPIRAKVRAKSIHSVHELKNQFNPHLPSGPVHPYQLDKSISNFRGAGVLFHFYSILNRYSC